METNFSINLKKYRELNNLSQNELSKKTYTVANQYNHENNTNYKGISQSTLNRWEANENSPSIDNLIILAKALHIQLIDLISSTDAEIKPDHIDSPKAVLKELLIEKGYMTDDEDISDEDLAKLIELYQLLKK